MSSLFRRNWRQAAAPGPFPDFPEKPLFTAARNAALILLKPNLEVPMPGRAALRTPGSCNLTFAIRSKARVS